MRKLSRSGKTLVAALAVIGLLAGSLTCILCSVSAQGDNPLEQLLKDTELKYRALDEESWVVPFDIGEGQTIDVYVTYNNEKKKFAMIFATVVNKDDKHDYNQEILLECMKLNNDYPACKFCLDYDNGDIDCQSEVYMETLTSKSLDLHINLVASVASEHQEKLQQLVR